jgi:hypothetical protein
VLWVSWLPSSLFVRLVFLRGTRSTGNFIAAALAVKDGGVVVVVVTLVLAGGTGVVTIFGDTVRVAVASIDGAKEHFLRATVGNAAAGSRCWRGRDGGDGGTGISGTLRRDLAVALALRGVEVRFERSPQGVRLHRTHF